MSRHDPKTAELSTRIKDILACREIKRVSPDTVLTRAAILLPLFLKDEACHLLLTKRTDWVRHHKREISFPGGIVDPTDEDLLGTALREAYEEVGVKSEDVEIVGELDEVVTKSNFVVSPFVGTIPYPYSFVLSNKEIEELIFLPLRCLLEEGTLTEERRTHQDMIRMSYTYLCGGHIIWGATARILKQLLDLIAVEVRGG